MNKAEFIERVAKRTRLPKSQTENFLDAAIDIIQDSVSVGEEIKFVGFGTFDRAIRKQRTGRNPKTGMSLTIPEAKVPRFRPGKEFKTLVNPISKEKP